MNSASKRKDAGLTTLPALAPQSERARTGRDSNPHHRSQPIDVCNYYYYVYYYYFCAFHFGRRPVLLEKTTTPFITIPAPSVLRFTLAGGAPGARKRKTPPGSA